MSSQLVASAVSRATSSVTTFARSSLIPHPAVPLKSSHAIVYQCHRYTTIHASSNSLQYSRRIKQNVARLYARRMIELASMSAATLASTTRMEGMTVADKPLEWTTIDLVKQRKEFGESISSLGKTKFSRVWAAGKIL